MVKSKFKFKYLPYVWGTYIIICMISAICLFLSFALLSAILDGEHFDRNIITLAGFIIFFIFMIAVTIKSSALFIRRVKIDDGDITLYNILTPFNPPVYSLNEFTGYFLTQETHYIGRYRTKIEFDVAWLSIENVLIAKVPNLYRNFNDIMAATNLEYKRQLPSAINEPFTNIKEDKQEQFNQLLQSVKKEKSASQANLKENELCIKKDKTPTVYTEKEEAPKTYNWNFNNNNDTI